jgi:type IV secretion system protein VirB10
MSGSNVFGNSPVAASFASPLVKVGVLAGVIVLVGGAYMLLSGQANSIFHGASGPPAPPPAQTAPQTMRFQAMPPVTTERPRIGDNQANTGGGNTGGGGGNNPDQRTLGIVSRLDLLSVRSSNVNQAPQQKGGDGPNAQPDKPKGELEASLESTDFAPTGVTELKHLDYLVEVGRNLPCTQMSFVNTTFAGDVTAIIPEVIKGETGDVELIGAGAKLWGTIQHGTVNGVDRVFAAWQLLTTPLVYDDMGVPHQFRVKINSPAADGLGQTGMSGDLNRHLGQKITAVFGISLIQGLTSNLPALLQGSRNGSNNNSPTLNFNQLGQGAESGANLLMKQFLDIPDVLTRLQGKGCAVQLVRDIDLKAAYPQLRSLLAMRKAR